MQIYLPIAEQSMNVFVLLGLGAAAGLLAGMFGVGGGFLATPLLIFVGIPPAVAVASQANQVVANSVSSLQVHWRRGNVDFRMGAVLLLGGVFGLAPVETSLWGGLLVTLVVAVSDDLKGKVSAVDLVRAGVEALGGKGGGGRPDMAQGGGPDGAKAEAALDAVRGVIASVSAPAG